MRANGQILSRSDRTARGLAQLRGLRLALANQPIYQRRNAVAGLTPEQAISCEDREGNGKCAPHTPRENRERQQARTNSPDQSGVTAGETAHKCCPCLVLADPSKPSSGEARESTPSSRDFLKSDSRGGQLHDFETLLHSPEHDRRAAESGRMVSR